PFTVVGGSFKVVKSARDCSVITSGVNEANVRSIEDPDSERKVLAFSKVGLGQLQVFPTGERMKAKLSAHHEVLLFDASALQRFTFSIIEILRLNTVSHHQLVRNFLMKITQKLQVGRTAIM